MTELIIFDFPPSSPLGNSLRTQLKAEEGKLEMHSFPDSELYLKIKTPVKGKHVIVNASLPHTNHCMLGLFFLGDALRQQGAAKVTLLAPYLMYMRQDKVFSPGEALTSQTFAKLLSSTFDQMITVDPHLHRYHSLSEIYTIPTTVVHAAPLLRDWVLEHVDDPFFIGPDEESRQWVESVAGDLPFEILKKKRTSHGNVTIKETSFKKLGRKVPVLIDDIISSGDTMMEALHLLKEINAKKAVCLAIHPIFSGMAYQKLIEVGPREIVTCNTLPHPTAKIDLAPLLAENITNVEKGI